MPKRRLTVASACKGRPSNFLRKDDSFDLGPPRDARKWQRAKDYAASVGRAGDWPFLIQAYEMLALLPAYKALEADGSHAPPKGVREACRRGLELRGDHGGSGLTPAAVAWARRIAAGKPVPPAKIAKMNAFFARHAIDRKPGWGTGKPTPGYVAHLLWGGDAGRSWAAAMKRRLDKANVGRKMRNGRREGVWRYARRRAEEEGKDEDYANAIAQRMMGKSSGAGPLASATSSWAAGAETNAAERGRRRLRVSPLLEDLASGGRMAPAPDRMVIDIDDAVRDLPLVAEKRKRLADKLRAAVKVDGPRRSSQEGLRSALREHGRGLHPAIARRLAHRIEHLCLSSNRSAAGPAESRKHGLSQGPATRRNHPMSKRRMVLKAGGEGSRGGKIIGHTRSGKPVYGSAGHTQHSGFSASDHQEAAGLHRRQAKRMEARMGQEAAHAPQDGNLARMNHHVAQSEAHASAAHGLMEPIHAQYRLGGAAQQQTPKKALRMRLDLSKAPKYIKRERKGDRWVYTYASDGHPGGSPPNAAGTPSPASARGATTGAATPKPVADIRSPVYAKLRRLSEENEEFKNEDRHDGDDPSAYMENQWAAHQDWHERALHSAVSELQQSHPGWSSADHAAAAAHHRDLSEDDAGAKHFDEHRYVAMAHDRAANGNMSAKEKFKQDVAALKQKHPEWTSEDHEAEAERLSNLSFAAELKDGPSEESKKMSYISMAHMQAQKDKNLRRSSVAIKGLACKAGGEGSSGGKAPKIKNNPWEGKSMQRSDFRKAIGDGAATDSSGDAFEFLGGQQPFGYARIDSSTGAQIEADADSFDELARIMADFDGATQRGQVLGALTADQEPVDGVVPPENPAIDTSGNAPAEVPETPVSAATSAAPSEDVMTKSARFLEASHDAAAADSAFVNLPLYQFVPSPDIEKDDRFVFVGRG